MSAHHPESFASQFEKLSGLTEWIAWAIAMVLVFGVLSIAMIANSKAAIEWGMYIAIGGLGIGLIIKGFFDARFLDRETKLASQQVAILEEVDDFDTFLDRAPISVFRSHIDNLYTISLSQPDVYQDNLIEVLHSRLMAKNRVVELFASILITLGLIGTILGLIMMMDGLSAALATPSGGDGLLDKIADPDSGPLAGLGTAFYTTLAGAIFGGVILRVLTSVIDASIMRYTAHLAELTEVHVLPYMRQLAKDREHQRLLERERSHEA